MRQRGAPFAPDSRSSASILGRLSAVTVSAHGLPTHLSVNSTGEFIAAEGDIANDALLRVGNHQRHIGGDRDQPAGRFAVQIVEPFLRTAKLLHKTSLP